MAQTTGHLLTTSVNSGTAIVALSAATRAVDAAQDATAKLLAMRKEFERLRAEHDRARDRADDLEREAKALRAALSRTNPAPGNLRRRGRWLVKSLALLVTAFVAAGSGTARATTPDLELAYACTMGERPTIHLDLVKGRFWFANRVGPLRKGMGLLNFTTPAGYTVFLDFGDLDRVYARMPATISGSGQVAKGSLQDAIRSATEGKDFGNPEFIVCQRTR